MFRPILFNTEMVKALLEGRKTVTRRLIKPQPLPVVNTLYRKDGTNIWRSFGADWWYEFQEPCVPGDILWVRETWCESMGQAGKYFYRAYAGPTDEMKEYAHSFNRWRPSIHMPREAARIFLKVTDVHAEKLREMVLADVLMDGIQEAETYEETWDLWHRTWDSCIKPSDLPTCGWQADPWVWVIRFERCQRPERGGEG